MAKGLGNGAAIGATLMKTELSTPLAGKLFFNTFGSDPFQTAQAKVTLEIIKEEKLIQNAKTMGNYLMEGLKTLQKKHPWIGDVRGRGLMMGIELVKNRDTKEYATQETVEVMEIAKDKGVLFGKGGLFGNVLRIAPPLSITKENCDEILKVLDESFFEAKSRLKA